MSILAIYSRKKKKVKSTKLTLKSREDTHAFEFCYLLHLFVLSIWEVLSFKDFKLFRAEAIISLCVCSVSSIGE